MMRLSPVRRIPLAVVSLPLVALVTAGTALAARPASSPGASPPPVAQPKLTANTNAGCNTPQPKGFVRCLAVVRTPSPGSITPQASTPPSTALGPADIRSAYHLPASGGGGQTVAIVDAFGDSTAEQDLAVFRAHYGLPPCTTANGCFSKVDQNGGKNYPPDDTGWALETSLDLDAVSAACPACNILLVEGNSNSLDDLGTAVDTAVSLGAKFVSNSYGASPEDPILLDFDHYYNHPGVVIAASSGDTGNVTEWPSINPNVVAVGGTSLTKDTSTSRGWDETVWGTNVAGANGGGSGCSTVEPHPDYQNEIATNCPNNRAVVDIAADADPASGLATYDTNGQGGWLQVGGTSLAAPLVTAMYAMAGTAQSGVYPVGQLYHDPNLADDLFDVTSGANGSCGNVLCQAGPGWDGPTGLGTPNGLGALRPAPQGTLSGQVTDRATGTPIAGVTVSANPGHYVTRTDATGHYQMTLAAGTYDLTAKVFGYGTATASGVVVAADATTTHDVVLARVPSATLSGTVTDGSGHGWGLHAKISISPDPNGPIYTDPVTGNYSVVLPLGDYTLDVSTDYPGYHATTEQVTLSNGDVHRDIALSVDEQACTAPGYGWNGRTADFAGGAAATTRAGWTVAGSRAGWRFDNPGDRPPPQTPPLYLPGGDDEFAVADDTTAGGHRMDTTLTSPTLDLSGQDAPELDFDSAYYGASGQSASVEVSTDGGRTWSRVWAQGSANAIGHVSIPLPKAARRTGVRVRFHYTAHRGVYWGIDNVFVGTHTCVARPGGLVTGVVTDRATGKPVDGAQVSDTADVHPPVWPAGLAQATTDPALPGGFYWLFTPAGHRHLATAAAGHTTATTTVEVTANQVTRHDIALTADGS